MLLEIILIVKCLRARKHFKAAGIRGVGGYGWKIWGLWLLVAGGAAFFTVLEPSLRGNSAVPVPVMRAILVIGGYVQVFGLAKKMRETGEKVERMARGTAGAEEARKALVEERGAWKREMKRDILKMPLPVVVLGSLFAGVLAGVTAGTLAGIGIVELFGLNPRTSHVLECAALLGGVAGVVLGTTCIRRVHAWRQGRR